VLEHPFLFFGHAQHELAGDATASDDAGQAERHRPDSVLLAGQHGNHEDPFFVADDGAHDPGYRRRHAVAGESLAFVDAHPPAADRRRQIVLDLWQRGAVGKAVLLEPDRSHGRARPDRKRAVPVLADDVGVHGVFVHVEKLAELMPQTRPVQDRPAAEDQVRWPGGSLDRDPGQHVHRVAHQDHDRLWADPVEFAHGAGDDARIDPGQVQPGLTDRKRRPHRDHHHVRAIQIGILGGGNDHHLRQQRDRVTDIPGLSLRPGQIAIVKDDQITHAKQHQRVRYGRADTPGPKNRHLRTSLTHASRPPPPGLTTRT
jgi:hypothetical protein